MTEIQLFRRVNFMFKPTVLTSLFILWNYCASAASADPWVGTYKNISGRQDYRALVRKLTITKGKNRTFHVQVFLWTSLTSTSGPIKLESIAQGFSDFNEKDSSGDKLVASFPSAKNKSLIVIRQESPYAPTLNEHSHYRHLSYTYYEEGRDFNSFVTGDVYREDQAQKRGASNRR